MTMRDKRHCSSFDDFQQRIVALHNTVRDNEYVIISLDLDSFDSVNDLFGYVAGDRVLHTIEELFTQRLEADEFFIRVHADHFIFFVKNTVKPTPAQRFTKLCDVKKELKQVLPVEYNLIASGGIVPYTQERSLASHIDTAHFLRKLAKGNPTHTFLEHSLELAKDLEWQKDLTASMELALENDEFEVYFQPKMLLKTGQIVGCEALARWNHKKYGLLLPKQFIPVFERTGFIYKLDYFMLEEVCKFLSENSKKNIPVLPISVNFSKKHLYRTDFTEKVFQIVNKYEVLPKLIELEIPEDVLVDDLQNLKSVFSALKYLGFTLSIDNFGKACSALHYLRDLPVDIIKIDRCFLEESENKEKSRIIIAKTMELIKSMGIISLVEGVETEEDLNFIKKLSCDLVQGYYYSKPLHITNYKKLLNESACAYSESSLFALMSDVNLAQLYQTEVPQEFQMDNWELYTLGKTIDMGLMKGYLTDNATVQYVNDKALEYLGYTRKEFREKFNNSISAFTHPEDAHIVQENAKQLIESGVPLAFQTRAIRKDGNVIILKGRASSVKDNQGRTIGIYAFQDVTEELKRTEDLQNSLKGKILELETVLAKERQSREALRISEERYRLIVEQSDDIIFDWNFEDDTIYFSDKYEDFFGQGAVKKNFSANRQLRQRVFPEDLPAFNEWVQNTFKQTGCIIAEFRLARKDGKYVWLKAKSTAISDGNGKSLKAVGVFSNIDKQKTELTSLKIKSQLDPLTRLFNKTETQTIIERYLEELPNKKGAFFIVDVDNFKGINDALGHQFGDTVLQDVSNKIRRIFLGRDIIGRLGGDEFAIFMVDCESPQAIKKRANTLLQILRNTYFGTETKYSISGSIGIALYPEQATTFRGLYKYADIALYESKAKGKNCYTFYHENLTAIDEDTRTPVEFSERFVNSYFTNDPIFNVFEMLYETRDISITLDTVLEILGKRFLVDRVYVFEFSDDNVYGSNTYEWCAPGIKPEKQNLQQFLVSDFSQLFHAYSSEGILSCNDIRQLDPFSYESLKKQNIKSLLHCAILNEGQITGFIGFDSCREYRSWRGDEVATLGYISRVLSVFLLKTQIKKELLTTYENHVSMLDNLNGFVYVIDSATYEVLYTNSATQHVGITVGSKCHEAAFGSDTPCENCPVKKITPENPRATEEIYSVLLDSWVSSAASKIKWAGRKNAALICCTDINKYMKNKSV